MTMTMTIYRQDGSSYDIENVIHVLQHSHDCTIGLNMEVMTVNENGEYSMQDIQLEPWEFYSMDI